MASTCSPQNRSSPLIQREVGPSSKLVENIGRNKLCKLRESGRHPNLHKGASTTYKDASSETYGWFRRFVQCGNRNPASDESESLSDIDDAEVVGYLLNKEEVCYKRLLWEMKNAEYAKSGKRKCKRANEAEKSSSVKRVAKTTKTTENERALSSKIDYDALKKLNDELEENIQVDKTEDMHFESTNVGNVGFKSLEMCEFGEGNCKDLDHGAGYYDDDIF